MPDKPLLIFPKPTRITEQDKGSGFPPKKLNTPSRGQQWDRLNPKFNLLQKAIDDKKLQLQEGIDGAEAELVLVVEIRGLVDQFFTAVKNTEGLEWLGDYEMDDADPDDIYFYEDDDETIERRLYIVATNARALQELKSLWERYVEDPQIDFNKGQTGFKHVFEYIHDIRLWGIKDRFLDTGVLEDWERKIHQESDDSTLVPFEIELWFRENIDRRNSSIQIIKKLISDLGGNFISECCIPEIAYHSAILELPVNKIKEILADQEADIKLLSFDNIMYFRPTGQTVAIYKDSEEDLPKISDTPKVLPEGKPIIALLDGLPLSNHTLLSNRLILDDPDNYEENYEAKHRRHGTNMASLIIHDDLEIGAYDPIDSPLYCRPVLKPARISSSEFEERIPENVSIVDLFHRAVRRLFEGDGKEEAVAPTIKIINVSIGDPTRQFFHSTSPLAKLLDWLSVKYDVLFIISAGNFPDKLPLSESDVDHLIKRESAVVQYVINSQAKRKILSPAESINNLTVGALHSDNSNPINTPNLFDPYTNELPSPISLFGFGYNRSVKPDIVYMGGRTLYMKPLPGIPGSKPHPIESHPPGIKAASPSNVLGDLDSTGYISGTSVAAALTTRLAYFCYKNLIELVGPDNAPITSLVKAMIVHSSNWGDMFEQFQLALGSSSGDLREKKKQFTKWSGYGVPDIERVSDCTNLRATAIGYGELKNNQAELFLFPIPESISGVKCTKRLIVTLAYFSPTLPLNRKYRNAKLWFDIMNKSEFIDDNIEVRQNTSKMGTLQHTIFESQKAIPVSENLELEIRVNCQKDAAKIEQPVRYALFVTLEIIEDIKVDIYEEIRSRITTQVRITP